MRGKVPHHLVHWALAWLALGWPVFAQSPQDLAAKAARAMQSKDYAAAEDAYRQVTQLVPGVAEMHSNLGMACYFQQKLPCAEKAFTRAVALKPELFLPNFLLAEVLFKRSEFQRALPLLERAVQQQPKQKEVRELLIATLAGLGQYDRAVTQYQEVLHADPSDLDAYYGLGKIYMELGLRTMGRLREHPDADYGSLLAAERTAPAETGPPSTEDPAALSQRTFALNLYKDAFATNVSVQGARIGYAQLQIAAREWAAARQTLEEELREDPWSYEAQYEHARAALGAGDFEEAARRLDEAAAIRPEFFLPLPELDIAWEAGEADLRGSSLVAAADRGSFGAALMLARWLETAKRAEEARIWLGRAEQSAKNILRDVRSGVSAKVAAARDGGSEPIQTGLELLRRKRYEEGLEILLPAANSNKSADPYTLEVARALYRTGRDKELAEVFGTAGPSQPEMIYLLGSAYRRLALANLEKLVELDPDSARAHQILGDALFVQEKYGEASAEYERALETQPKNAELHFLLGNSYYKQMQFPLAADVFRRVTQLDPLHAEGFLMLGDALVQMGDNEPAIANLEKSIELDPQLEQAYPLLGKAYRSLGDLERARHFLEKGAIRDQDGSVHYQLFILYRALQQPQKAKEALRKSQQLRKNARGRGV